MHVISAFSLILCVIVILFSFTAASGQSKKSSKSARGAKSTQTAKPKTTINNTQAINSTHPAQGVQPVGAAQPVKGGLTCSGKNGLTPSAMTEILDIHNQARAKLNLGKLVWDCDLASYAQEWADHGVAEHRADCFFGESIFVGGAPDISPNIGIQRWINEGSAWDNKNAVCQTGKTCTHYTQLMWKKTTKIGCGINRGLTGPWKMMLVCNYDPAGNTAGPAY
jgi:hypothetical protein